MAIKFIPKSEVYFVDNNLQDLLGNIRDERASAQVLKKARSGARAQSTEETLAFIGALEEDEWLHKEEIDKITASLGIKPKLPILNYKTLCLLGQEKYFESHINWGATRIFRPAGYSGGLHSLETDLRSARADSFPSHRYQGMPALIIAHDSLKPQVDRLVSVYCKY